MTPLPHRETFLMVVALAAGIMLTRFLPFLLFSDRRRIPAGVLYLGNVLPHAAVGLLVVYCLKDVSLALSPHGLPEALGVAFTSLLHVWRRNALASIGCGTLFYMWLVQSVFA